MLVRVTFGDGQSPTYCNQACVKAAMWGPGESVNNVFNEASFGKVTFPESKGKIMDVTIPKSPGGYQGCDTAGYAADAIAAVKRQGVNVDAYDHQVFYIADMPILCPGYTSFAFGGPIWTIFSMFFVSCLHFRQSSACRFAKRHCCFKLNKVGSIINK